MHYAKKVCVGFGFKFIRCFAWIRILLPNSVSRLIFSSHDTFNVYVPLLFLLPHF